MHGSVIQQPSSAVNEENKMDPETEQARQQRSKGLHTATKMDANVKIQTFNDLIQFDINSFGNIL